MPLGSMAALLFRDALNAVKPRICNSIARIIGENVHAVALGVTLCTAETMAHGASRFCRLRASTAPACRRLAYVLPAMSSYLGRGGVLHVAAPRSWHLGVRR